MFSMFRQTISGQLFWMGLARRHCCLPAEPQVIDFGNYSDYVFTLVCRFAIIEQARNTFLASIGWAVIITYAGSKISYFGNNDLSLPQFRPSGNDSKHRSERFRDNKKLT